MKKIENIYGVQKCLTEPKQTEVIIDKINELVDAVNELNELHAGLMYNHKEHKQTQEPERKEEECHHKKCVKGYHKWYSAVPYWYCQYCDSKMRQEPKPEKEPECEHEWKVNREGSLEYCNKCSTSREKPAKKECVKRIDPLIASKDELAERLDDIDKNHPDYWNALADEARKWAVEVVDGLVERNCTCWVGVGVNKKELLERLRGGK